MKENEELKCPSCGGSGSVPYYQREIVNYVTRDMAIDGGDRNLEGQPIYGEIEYQEPCSYCNGTGYLTTQKLENKK